MGGAEPREGVQEEGLRPKATSMSTLSKGVLAATSMSRSLPPIQGKLDKPKSNKSDMFSRSSYISRSSLPLSTTSINSAAIESGPIGKFKAEVSKAQPKLLKHVEAFISQKDIIKTCDAVLAASGSGFEGVYLAVWNLISLVEGDQLELYVDVVQPLLLRAEDGPGRGQARQTVYLDLAKLYIHASEAKTPFDTFVRSIGRATGAEVDLPDALKQSSRVFEKILFDFKNPGSCEKIVDIIRGMLKATSMQQVTKIAMAFLESDEIVIVRIKDRFLTKPSQGGWRDLLINFYMADDPNCHICEVQVVLAKMLVARKGLGGHEIFGRSRNALETLEAMNADDPAKRWERASYLRKYEDYPASELVDLGYEVIDLVRAGYTDDQLLGEEGVTDAELSSARATITSERWQGQGQGLATKARGLKRSDAVETNSFRAGGIPLVRVSSKVMPDRDDSRPVRKMSLFGGGLQSVRTRGQASDFKSTRQRGQPSDGATLKSADLFKSLGLLRAGK